MKTYSIVFLSLILAGGSIVAQSKKERAVELNSADMTAPMYNSTTNKEALSLYREGQQLTLKKDYKGAIKLYKKALKLDPEFIEAYDDLGVAYRRLGDLKNAMANYKISIEKYPQGMTAHMNLAVVYLIQKEYDKALEEYKIMQELEPDNPEGHYGATNVYLNTGKYKEAIASGLRTMEIYEATNSPYLYELYMLVGLAYYYDKDVENAKTYLQMSKDKGMKLDPTLIKELQLK